MRLGAVGQVFCARPAFTYSGVCVTVWGWRVGDEYEWAVSEWVVDYDHGLCVDRRKELFFEYVA